jgi:hypothetical protein
MEPDYFKNLTGPDFFRNLRILVPTDENVLTKLSQPPKPNFTNTGASVVLQVIQAIPQFRKTSVFDLGSAVMTRSSLSN